MPAYNEIADIDVINGNMDKIDVQMKKNADSAQQSKDIVSDEYSATNTYAVGDYCIHENVLYKCKTAITTGEAFDSSKWVQTTCGTEFGELNSNLTDLSKLTGDKSILFNQLIPLFSSSNWIAEENASVSFENNVATVTNTVENFGIKTIRKVEQIEQNIYYFSFELKTTSKLKVYFGWGESGAAKIDAYENTGGVFKRFYALKKSSTNSNSNVYIWTPEVIDTFSVKNAKVVNLTKMFGAGKEPTVKEFENLFPNDCYEQTNGIPISNIGIASSIERINES